MGIIKLILDLLRNQPIAVTKESTVIVQKIKKVVIKRNEHSVKAIRGELKIEDLEHTTIYTLENPKRDTKEDSAIPAGIYTCVPYSGTKYKDVYMIKDVPDRTAILIHNGNIEANTLGCILVGLSLGELKGEPAVLESKKALDYLRNLIGKESFNLEIID